MSDPCAEADEDFILANTALSSAPLVPEIGLYLASEITPIWQATEAWLTARNIAPPYWAFAWPGGQALARHVLDHPSLVAGLAVLDFAAGSGIAGIACARAGAAAVSAADIDPLAVIASGLNAEANGVRAMSSLGPELLTGLTPPPPPPARGGGAIRSSLLLPLPLREGAGRRARCNGVLSLEPGDIVGQPCRWDLILCGDVCYESHMTTHILPWLRAMARMAEVWVADPGRAYLPRAGLIEFARYTVPTSLELEDRATREVVLYRLSPD